MVSQTLIGLERAGLIERELDVDRNRCHAIRVLPAGESPAPRRRPPRREHDHVNQVPAATAQLRAERDRLRRQLENAEHELGVAIRRGVELARRIEDLESKLKAALTLAARTPSGGGPAVSETEAASKLVDETLSSL